MLTSKQIEELSNAAFKIAKDQGFYPHGTDIETHLMLIITEMSEAIQADRKPDPDTSSVEEETADVAIRILSLLGYMNKKKPFPFLTTPALNVQYNLCLYHTNCTLPQGFYRIIERMGKHDLTHQPFWYTGECMQKILAMLFSLAKNNGIDLLPFILAKMEKNKSRGYKHGRKY